MKILLLMLFTPLIFNLFANNLDFFDEEGNSTFEESSKSVFQTRLRVKYENSFDKTREQKSTILYQNISDDDYYIDYDFSTNFEDGRLNLKEIYYKKELSEKIFLDIGRVNIREGVARGHNPTDYFKGAGLLFDSLVASDRRENRLGSFLVQNTIFLDGATIKLIYSPKISINKGLGIDITNETHRSSIYTNIDVSKDLYSSVILHNNEEGVNLGLNLSYALNKWIFYNEISIKKSQKNMANAIKKLALSPELKQSFDSSQQTIYQGSFGLSYSSENNIVATLEYLVNNAGMGTKEWRDYFLLGERSEKIKQQLLSTRRYFQINEKMMSKETLFAHIGINEVSPDLDVSMLAFINPKDKSSLAQIGMKYQYQEDFLVNLSAKKTFGDTLSEYGSLDNSTIVMVELEYFF